MALSPFSALSSPVPFQTAVQPMQQTSASQLYASFEKALIDITTSDGDIVTLQHSSSHAALSQSVQWQNNVSQGASVSAQTLDTHSFSFSVQGDLSLEELEDLGDLFDSLSLIAADFYQGNMDGAIGAALNIGDLGSLSSVSATFTKSEISASQITSVSANPYAQAQLTETDNEEHALARQRQAQWQQILTYLETRKQDAAQLEEKDTPQIKDHDQAMMARIKQTIDRHPRLAHHAHKLAQKAISDRQHGHKNSPTNEKQDTAPDHKEREHDHMSAPSQRA